MVSKGEILDKLRAVMDPELGINVVDLGLIYGMEIKRKQKGKPRQVKIKMTFTTPACPMMGQMLEQIKGKLDEIADTDIEVSVTFEPLWSPERLSQKARIKLGIV